MTGNTKAKISKIRCIRCVTACRNIFEDNKAGARLSHILRKDAGVLWAGKTIYRLDLLIEMLNRGVSNK